MKFWNPWFLRAKLRTRHLLLLSAIGEEGNICRAAELLSMSQPAASRLLRELEEIIGAELFERRARGVKATWYGEALIRHARNALSSLTEAAAEIDALKAGRTGQVNIGSISGAAVDLVPRTILNVARDYPLVRVHVVVDSSKRLAQSLDDGDIDLMVGRLLADHDNSRFWFDRLGMEQVCAATRKGHALLDRQGLELSELVDVPWVVPPAGSMLRHRYESMFRNAGLECPARLVETESPMVLTRLLEKSDFVAILSREVHDYYAGHGLIAELPLPLPSDMDPFGIITRKGWLLSPAALLVRDALEDAVLQAGRIASSPRRRDRDSMSAFDARIARSSALRSRGS
ncbi:MAG TPA: LysR substrate-binding domain-containing protein [Steroidobacteraceae bacterium]|nr:LysR substrate-binding domain-containing protein [Steroidobacteraceae bacterium]